MSNIRSTMYPELRTYVAGLLKEAGLISDERKALLVRLTDYINQKRASGTPVALHFICTHNSRRSHISQIWAATAAAYFGMENIGTFSGLKIPEGTTRITGFPFQRMFLLWSVFPKPMMTLTTLKEDLPLL